MNPPPADLELVSFHLCPYVQRAIIVLLEKGIPHRRTYVDLSDKPEWFRRISPLGKVPLLRTGGEVLFESSVICEYLDEVTPGTLHPADPLARARHRAWIEFGAAILGDIAGLYSAPDANAHAAKRERISTRFAWLERNLGEGPLFDGERFHLVDAVYPTVFRYFDVIEAIGDRGYFSGLPRVSAYRRELARRASVAGAVVPEYPRMLEDFIHRRGGHLGALAGADGHHGAPDPVNVSAAGGGV